MSFVQNVATQFHPVTCCECGCVFAIDETLNDRARIWKKRSIWCPGCGVRQGWSGETPAEKVRRELEAELARVKRSKEYSEADATRQRERAQSLERSLAATKGAATRLKNRIKNGVCPCCNRTFQDLCRHMKTQHPDFADKSDPAEAASEGDSGGRC